MIELHLQCITCNSVYDIVDKYQCDRCSGILEVKHNYDKIKDIITDEFQSPPSYNIWKYKYLLPVIDSKCMVTLYEGGTPLIKSNNLSRKTGFKNLYFKDESRNPSGAFKDRPMAVGISKAKEFGRDTVATASSGNAAASLAAYAAKAGIKSYIFIPENTPAGKVTQAAAAGGNLIKVKGNYSHAYSIARMASEKFLWMNITTTFLNPYAIEGDKTIAYELYCQLNKEVPDWILVPTGAGPLVFGIFKGFMELKILGLTEKTPRMAAVQAADCSPIVRAFESGKSGVEAWSFPNTIASAIADPLKGYEKDGELVLKIIQDSNGTAVSVTDDEIIESVFDLAKNEGIYSEPAAAAAFAGFKKLASNNTISVSDTAVCIITGHGLKDPDSVAKNIEVPIIEPDLEELSKYIG
jgi:threonine synthase